MKSYWNQAKPAEIENEDKIEDQVRQLHRLYGFEELAVLTHLLQRGVIITAHKK